MPRRPRYTIDQVRAAVASSRSFTEALRVLGLRTAGGNFNTIRDLVVKHAIPTDHLDPNWTRRGPRNRRSIPLEEVLVPNCHYQRRDLKRRLFAEGLKERSCEWCGQTEEWRGRRMALILDHVNGVATDNRLENLRILCPNCAATLDTHCARKNRIQRDPKLCLLCGQVFLPKYDSQRYCSQFCGTHRKTLRKPKLDRRNVPRPSYDQLMEDLSSMSYCAVGRKYGVSDNAVRKWIRWYGEARDVGSGEDAGDAPIAESA